MSDAREMLDEHMEQKPSSPEDIEVINPTLDEVEVAAYLYLDRYGFKKASPILVRRGDEPRRQRAPGRQRVVIKVDDLPSFISRLGRTMNRSEYWIETDESREWLAQGERLVEAIVAEDKDAFIPYAWYNQAEKWLLGTGERGEDWPTIDQLDAEAARRRQAALQDEANARAAAALTALTGVEWEPFFGSVQNQERIKGRVFVAIGEDGQEIARTENEYGWLKVKAPIEPCTWEERIMPTG